jgi:multicomponent Na+:H+ antiporter subunit E
MILFMLNLLLAVIWAAITGEFTTGGFLTGFVIGYGILWLVHPLFIGSRYFARFPKLLALISIYVVDLVRANVRLAKDVLTPQHYMRPAILAVPLQARTALEITLLSNLISMTPGSLTVDVSDDRKTLYVHVVYAENPDEVRRQIQKKLEARLLEVLR